MTEFNQENQENTAKGRASGRNKKGGVKGTTIAIVIMAVALVVAVLIGVGSSLLLLANIASRERNDRSASNPITNTEPAIVEVEPDQESEEDQTDSKSNVLPVASELPEGELSTQAIVNKVGPATVTILADVEYDDYWRGAQTGQSSGSGFIITSDGYVVTNAHVISRASSVSVKIPGSADPLPAEIIGSDTKTDIAILKIDRTDLPYVELGSSSDLNVGERAVAIGNPFGSLDGTVTQGVISALGREIPIEGGPSYNLLQTDASINEGNSGGPLLNGYGQVIGVTNAKLASGEGIGFAIPIDDIRDVMESLISYGYVAGRPVIGVVTGGVNEESNRMLGIPFGLYVSAVVPGSPAEQAGLQVADVIVEVDGEEVMENSELLRIRDSHDIGDTLIFTVVRAGEHLEITLVLGEERPDQ